MNIRVIAFISVFALGSSTNAAPLTSAEVTRLFNRVELLSANSAPQPAAVGDVVTGKTAVQTGDKSRAELAFSDATIARLGANSFFSFEQGTRDLDLKEGVLLLQVPKNAGGANVNTAAVSAAITGTTVLIESRSVAGVVKFLVLEGTMRLRLKGRMGESVLVSQGQMLALDPSATQLPEPVVFDIKRLVETSGLLGREFRPLGNQPFIEQAALRQRELKNKGKLINLNYGISANRNPGAQLVEINNQSTSRTDAEVSELLAQRAKVADAAALKRQAIAARRMQIAQSRGQENPPGMDAAERARMQNLIRIRTLERIRERERLRPQPVPPPVPTAPVTPPPRPQPTPPKPPITEPPINYPPTTPPPTSTP